MKYLSHFIIFAALTATIAPATAQTEPDASSSGQIVIEPLFEYPVAPENIIDLKGKSNYLIEHFWDGMNFKDKNTVDQNALNDAFAVYASTMRWADKEAVEKSVDRLINAYSKNKALTLQFTKAAEEALYGERTKFWIDEVYIKFLDAIIANKKIPAERKQRYIRQASILKNSMVGGKAAAFEFTSPAGATERFRPGLLTVIEFGDPGCEDCQRSKLKMQMNVKFSRLLEQGIVNVLFIVPDPDEGWQEALADYPKDWHVGASESVADIYDLRAGNPTFYVIGKDGKIIAKNINVTAAMEIAIGQAEDRK